MRRISVFSFGLLLAPCSVFGQTTLFDGTYDTNDYIGYVPGSSFDVFNESGELFNLAYTGATINSLSSIQYQFSSPTSYSDLQLQITFFATGQTTFSGEGTEFSDPLMTVTDDFGSQTNISGSFNSSFTLPTPIHVAGTMIGAQFTWLDKVGSVLTPATNVLMGFSASDLTPPSIGSNAWSDDDNLSGTNINLLEFVPYATTSSVPANQWLNSYFLGPPTGGNYQYANIAVTLSGTAPTPEPSSFAFVGLGIIGLCARRVRFFKNR